MGEAVNSILGEVLSWSLGVENTSARRGACRLERGRAERERSESQERAKEATESRCCVRTGSSVRTAGKCKYDEDCTCLCTIAR